MNSGFLRLIVLVLALSGAVAYPALAATVPCTLNLALNTVSGNVAQAGTMVYTFAAQNVGGSVCTSTSVSLYYAQGESFLSSSFKPTAGGYYWQFGTLAPGAAVDLILATSRSAALAPGGATDEACLSADGAADACADAAPAADSAAPPVASTSVSPAPVVPTAPPPVPSAPAPKSTSSEFGVWEWTTLTQMSGTAQMQQIINEAATNGFNAIYLTIDDYLTIDALPAGTAKQQQLANYNQLVGEFLSFAAAKHISVDAEAGWRDWGYSSNQWESADIMSFVANYNAGHAQKFRGVQYDVEPYLLPEYATTPAPVLTRYLQMVENLVNQDKALGIPLSFDIPHFYDDVIGWTPEITLDGITAYPYTHLLRLMKQLPNSALLVMAYRNFATGTNSTVDLSQTEINEANATNVTVIVGQETGPVTPDYVTFSGTSKNYFDQQIGIVKQTFAPQKSFGGMAIDYLDPYLLLQ